MSLCQVCSSHFRCHWEQIHDFLRSSWDKEISPASRKAESSYETKPVKVRLDDFEGDDSGDSRDSGSPTGSVEKRLKTSSSPLNTTSSPVETCPLTVDSSPTHIASSTPPKVTSCCPSVACVACLGLLEEQYIQHLADVITMQFRLISPIGMKTFSLAIRIPLSITARGTGMETLMKKIVSDQDDPKPSASETSYIKDELRWQLRKELEKSLSPLTYNWDSPLAIILDLDHEDCSETCAGVKKLRPKLFPYQKRGKKKRKQVLTPITSLPLQEALNELSNEELQSKGYFLFPVSSSCGHHIELQHRSCFVAGRYNKYSRVLPQTPWVVDGVKKAESSVEELLCPKICSAFRASDTKFSSSGREDVDVLMLGQGRPFLLELVNPMNVSISELELESLEKQINTETDQVAVHNLKAVSKQSSVLLKQGEEDKRKVYSALVWTKEEIGGEGLQMLDEMTDLVIHQRTPIRVLHRRTLAVRERTIYCMKTEKVDEHHFFLRLETQAGTYIKEFVHGDFGRTQPNVGSLLGCDADILSLDVLDVHLPWPP